MGGYDTTASLADLSFYLFGGNGDDLDRLKAKLFGHGQRGIK